VDSIRPRGEAIRPQGAADLNANHTTAHVFQYFHDHRLVRASETPGRGVVESDLGDKFKWNYGVGFGFIVVAAFFMFHKW
jgi:hypothetical protein